MKLFHGKWLVTVCPLFTFLLARAVWEQITSPILEDDLLWILPVVFRSTEGKSFLESLPILLSPHHGEWAIPAISLFVFLVGRYVGSSAMYLRLFQFVLHAIISLSLSHFLRKEIRLPRSLSIGISLLFFSYIGHYHSYLWPVAVQHQLVVLITLLVFSLFLRAERSQRPLLSNPSYYLVALLAVLGSLTRISILIVPVGMITYLCFSKADAANGRPWKRLILWIVTIPLFCVYPILNFYSTGGSLAFRTIISSIPGIGQSGESHPIIILSGVASIGLILATLGAIYLQRARIHGALLFATVLSCVGIYIKVWGYWNHGLLIHSLLNPIGVAFTGTAPFHRWNQILDHPNPLYIAFGAVFGVLGIIYLCRKRRSAALCLIPIAILVHFYFIKLSEVSTIPSRHYLFLSVVGIPLFLIGMWEAFLRLSRRMGLHRRKVIFAMELGLLLLCFLHVNAIAIRIWRARLPDASWSFYHAAWAHRLEYLIQNNPFSRCIKGMEPFELFYSFSNYRGFVNYNQLNDEWDSVRAIFVSHFDDRRFWHLRFGDCTDIKPHEQNAVLTLSNSWNSDAPAYWDEFQKQRRLASHALNENRLQEALNHLEKSLAARSYSLRFLLSHRPLSHLPCLIYPALDAEAYVRMSFIYSMVNLRYPNVRDFMLRTADDVGRDIYDFTVVLIVASYIRNEGDLDMNTLQRASSLIPLEQLSEGHFRQLTRNEVLISSIFQKVTEALDNGLASPGCSKKQVLWYQTKYTLGFIGSKGQGE